MAESPKHVLAHDALAVLLNEPAPRPSLPVYPQYQTLPAPAGTSQKGHMQTSFDNLVGAEERRGNFEAERLGGLQIDEQLEFVGPIDRDVARFWPR
jgi:hypothetical protein